MSDEQWKRETDKTLVNLTSAQRSTDDNIEDLAGKLAELDELLHGQRSRSDSGLVGQVNDIETGLNSILRVMHPDSTGHSGLLNDFKEIKRQILKKEQSSEYRWKFWTAIGVALITSASLLVQSWPTIQASWNKKPESEVGKMIYDAKHPRIRKYKVRVIPPPPASDLPPGG